MALLVRILKSNGSTRSTGAGARVHGQESCQARDSQNALEQ